MDNAIDNTITFDNNGQCSYCRDAQKRYPKEYFPNGEARLKLIVEQIKKECINDKYDCIVGVSGGIDSSYILYMGYNYGLRMLAVHIDDGLDNPIATRNLNNLVKTTGCDYITIEPNRREYADIIYSLLKASVYNLAIGQDNLIIKALQDYGVDNKVKYILDGSNFAHESILEKGESFINSSDRKFILSIHNRFGRVPLKNIELMSFWEKYIIRPTNRNFKHVRPLNYIDYNLDKAIKELHDFCGFEYYGGKHYESILTRFMQCYYLPVKFGYDKRKSHYSSLIISGQMTREEALEKLNEPLYKSDDDRISDISFLADYMDITVEEMENLIKQPPKDNYEYPHSVINNLAPIARKFRRLIDV